MNTLFEITGLNSELLIYLAIDISIAILLLGAMKFVSGLSAQVNATDELSKEDNFAFGISVAGSIAALGIVLTGAITGEMRKVINGSDWHAFLRITWPNSYKSWPLYA